MPPVYRTRKCGQENIGRLIKAIAEGEESEGVRSTSLRSPLEFGADRSQSDLELGEREGGEEGARFGRDERPNADERSRRVKAKEGVEMGVAA